MAMMPYHMRMAELWTHSKRRPLSDQEVVELNHCMAANAKYCWDLVALHNLSTAAYITNDMDWLHDICAKIDALENKYNNKKLDK